MRDIGPLAAALVLTVLAHLGLPLPPSDPLRGTLVVLPLILVALRSVGRWAEVRGGEATPRKIVAGELTVLLLLIGITLARGHLGLAPAPWIDRCLAGGFVLLLAHRLVWLIRTLQTCLSQGLHRLPPAPFFVLPFVVYVAILPWTTAQRPPDGDAPHYLLLTHSLAFDFDTDLRNNYEQGDSLAFMGVRLEPQLGDPEGADGELYSRHNVLLPLLLAPFYRVAGLMGVLVMMAVLAAITSWLTLALAYDYEPDQPIAALLAWATLAFTAPLLLFSYQVWVEVPAAMLVLVGLIQVLRLRHQEAMSPLHWILFFSSVLLLPLLKIRFLLVAVPLAALALWQGKKRSRLVAAALVTTVLVLAGANLLFNQLAFDNPLKYHDFDGLRSYSQPASQYLQGFLGLLFDCAFGLFGSAPIWLLLIPAVFFLAQRRHPLLRDFLFVFLPYLLLLSPRGEWFGGWSPPFRYGIVMLPLLSLWLIPIFHDRRHRANDWLLGILLVFTLVLTTLWVVVPGWTFNLAHGRNHLLDILSIQIGADVARFFPSSTRTRVATYLWPVATVLTMAVLWRFRRRDGGRQSARWGVTLALLLPAALIGSAQTRATHLVEFEDPWIGQEEGAVYPDLWVVYRPRYRGGWTLYDHSTIPLPVNPGGTALDLEIELRLAPETGVRGVLELADGAGRILERASTNRFGMWTTLRVRDLSWPQDNTLTLTFRAPDDPLTAAAYSATLDRARLTWK